MRKRARIRGRSGGRADRVMERRVVRCQAVLAIQWLWSLSRLWVAVTNRHSDCAAPSLSTSGETLTIEDR